VIDEVEKLTALNIQSLNITAKSLVLEPNKALDSKRGDSSS